VPVCLRGGLYGPVFLDPVRFTGLWPAFLLSHIMTGLYALRPDGERPGPAPRDGPRPPAPHETTQWYPKGQ
jgi:hypothetical protein